MRQALLPVQFSAAQKRKDLLRVCSTLIARTFRSSRYSNSALSHLYVAITGVAFVIASANVRITADQNSVYMSADQLAGGTYTDSVLTRCGIDRRPQNEPTLAID